jgi:hypothetical protein
LGTPELAAGSHLGHVLDVRHTHALPDALIGRAPLPEIVLGSTLDPTIGSWRPYE